MDEKTIAELVREEQRRYYREWRQKNPEKVKAANQRYWAKRAAMRINNSAEVVAN